jgi:hypothetical protein
VVLQSLVSGETVRILADSAVLALPNGSYLQTLLFFLATVSLGSWSVVIATTLIRMVYRFSYGLLHKPIKVPTKNLDAGAYEEAQEGGTA